MKGSGSSGWLSIQKPNFTDNFGFLRCLSFYCTKPMASVHVLCLDKPEFLQKFFNLLILFQVSFSLFGKADLRFYSYETSCFHVVPVLFESNKRNFYCDLYSRNCGFFSILQSRADIAKNFCIYSSPVASFNVLQRTWASFAVSREGRL